MGVSAGQSGQHRRKGKAIRFGCGIFEIGSSRVEKVVSSIR